MNLRSCLINPFLSSLEYYPILSSKRYTDLLSYLDPQPPESRFLKRVFGSGQI